MYRLFLRSFLVLAERLGMIAIVLIGTRLDGHETGSTPNMYARLRLSWPRKGRKGI